MGGSWVEAVPSGWSILHFAQALTAPCCLPDSEMTVALYRRNSSLHRMHRVPSGLQFTTPLPVPPEFLATSSPFNLGKVEGFIVNVEQISIRQKRQTCYVTLKPLSHAGPQLPHPCDAAGAVGVPHSAGDTTSRHPCSCASASTLLKSIKTGFLLPSPAFGICWTLSIT